LAILRKSGNHLLDGGREPDHVLTGLLGHDKGESGSLGHAGGVGGIRAIKIGDSGPEGVEHALKLAAVLAVLHDVNVDVQITDLLDIRADVLLADGGNDLSDGHVAGDGVVGRRGDEEGYGVAAVIGEFLFIRLDGHITELNRLVEIVGAHDGDEFLIHLLAEFTVLVEKEDKSKRLDGRAHIRARRGRVALGHESILEGTGGRRDGLVGSGEEGADELVIGTLGDKEIGSARCTVRALDIVILVSVPIVGQCIVTVHISLLKHDRKIHARHGRRQLLREQGIIVAGRAVIGI